MNKIIAALSCCATMIVHGSEYYKDFAINGLIGAISSTCSMVVYTPFNYLQNRKIQGLPVEWKKPHHWYRGYITLAGNNIPVIALQTATYQYVRNLLHNRNECADTVKRVFAATVAGGVSGPINNMAQLVALHQQNKGLSILDTIHSFPDSYKSLHRATIPAIYRGILFANGYINCLPSLQQQFDKYEMHKICVIISSAFITSLFTTLTTQPMQVIMTKLHADIEKKKYNGMFAVIKKIIGKEGLRGFYKGSCYRLLGNTLAIPALNGVQQLLYAYR